MFRTAIAIALLATAIAPPRAGAVVCLTCRDDGNGGGDVTYDQAAAISAQWAADQGGARITVSCMSVEIGGAAGWDCAVGFDWNGHRYTAGCAIWDNTSAGGASGRNGCYITQVS